MYLSQLIHKFDLASGDIDRITEALLENRGLSEAQQRIGAAISLEQIYAVAQAVARELLGEQVSELCPQMALERMDLAEAHYDHWIADRERKREERRLRELEEEATQERTQAA